jgi:hypothetical protein
LLPCSTGEPTGARDKYSREPIDEKFVNAIIAKGFGTDDGQSAATIIHKAALLAELTQARWP